MYARKFYKSLLSLSDNITLGSARQSLPFVQANAMDRNLPVAKLGLAQIDLLRNEQTNAISLLESTLQDVAGWMDALKVSNL